MNHTKNLDHLGFSVESYLLEAALGKSPEARLWRAVLAQAIADARTSSAKKTERFEKARALFWFGTKDFATVCDYAGFEPSVARKKIAEALEKNVYWKRPTGQGWRTMRRLADQTFCPPL